MISGPSLPSLLDEDRSDSKEAIPERIAALRPQNPDLGTSKKIESTETEEKGGMKPFKIRTYGNQLPIIQEKKVSPIKGNTPVNKGTLSTNLQFVKASSGIFKENTDQPNSKLVSIGNRKSARGARSHSTVCPWVIR